MILDKLKCRDCDGTGRSKGRFGLCDRCSGEGKRRLSEAEQNDLLAKCRCVGGWADCTQGCAYLAPRHW